MNLMDLRAFDVAVSNVTSHSRSTKNGAANDEFKVAQVLVLDVGEMWQKYSARESSSPAVKMTTQTDDRNKMSKLYGLASGTIQVFIFIYCAIYYR